MRLSPVPAVVGFDVCVGLSHVEKWMVPLLGCFTTREEESSSGVVGSRCIVWYSFNQTKVDYTHMAIRGQKLTFILTGLIKN